MSDEPSPRLEKSARLLIAAFGVAAWLAAVPAGIMALMIVGFHGPLDEWDETVWLIALPLLPLLLVLLGLACFLCSGRRLLPVVKALAAACALDFVLIVASFHSMSRPDPLPPGLVTRAPPIDPAMKPVPGPGPVHVAIACSAAGDECWTIRYEDGREVSRERSPPLPGR